MPSVNGVVQDIQSQLRQTKYGQKPVFKITIDGNVYNMGFNKPKFAVGAELDFQYTDGSYGADIDQPTLRVVNAGAGSPAPTPTTTSSAPATSKPQYVPQAPKVFPIPPLHSDRAIIRQNALTNARELIVAKYKAIGQQLPEDTALKNEIVGMARAFESFTAGDADKEQALAEVASASKGSKKKTTLEEDLLE